MGSRLPDPAFWRGRRVLLTGHTGFKGSWAMFWLRALGAEVTGLGLAPEGDRPLFVRLGLDRESGHRVCDLRDPIAVDRLVAADPPEIVLHMAAQSLVRRGYAEPLATFATNVQGTGHLLDALGRARDLRAVLVVTSDKVYRNDDTGRRFRESDPLGGHDPYSASKAACEILVASWRSSFFAKRGVALATARAGNVIGGGDVAADRLVPDFFRALDADRPLILRNPAATRPWQHVIEPIAGYLVQLEGLCADPGTAPALNFGPDEASLWPVARVVAQLIAACGRGSWVQDGDPGPREAAVLALDPTLAAAAIGWRPVLSTEEALAWTADFWRVAGMGGDLARLCREQIDAYRERAQ
jgi:CDP-glucose 4,6-dehydratase